MKEIGIARVLTQMRREKGVTQDELAAHMGVSKASVSKWETGQSYPDITFLPLLAAYFGITIDDLMCYEPQMEKTDIARLYHRLADAFARQPFDDVHAEVQAVVRKYYSCWPLLHRMALLLVNHHTCAPDKAALLREAAALAGRVRTRSDDLDLAKEAALLEATCMLLLGEPKEVLTLLGDGRRPIMMESVLVAQAHQMLGEGEKAIELHQIAIYQALLLLVGTSPSYLLMVAGDGEKAEETIRRTLAVAGAYRLDALHSNTMAQFYLAAAQLFCMRGKADEAIGMLKRYASLCAGFSYTLRGDAYFDRIDGWFAALDLDTQLPRGKALIQESMLEAVAQNPAFQPLQEDIRFQNILETLKANIGGSYGIQ